MIRSLIYFGIFVAIKSSVASVDFLVTADKNSNFNYLTYFWGCLHIWGHLYFWVHLHFEVILILRSSSFSSHLHFEGIFIRGHLHFGVIFIFQISIVFRPHWPTLCWYLCLFHWYFSGWSRDGHKKLWLNYLCPAKLKLDQAWQSIINYGYKIKC